MNQTVEVNTNVAAENARSRHAGNARGFRWLAAINVVRHQSFAATRAHRCSADKSRLTEVIELMEQRVKTTAKKTHKERA